MKIISACKIIEKIRNNRFLLENISYFCIVKHLKKEFSTFLGIIFMMSATFVKAQEAPGTAETEPLDPMDSVEVSLLTCSPHEEIYSLYGHSALRWHDLHTGEDLAMNWGIFDFKKPWFVTRFVFGLTDYELGVIPYPYFAAEYKSFGSSVVEQVLNLTVEEKRNVWMALRQNMRPENRVYRYNYFYDNCSIRPRNLVERCLNGKVEYEPRQDYTPSYREMIHKCTRNHPWAAFGNDLLLGVKADMKTGLREQEFLPENLLYDFDRATITATDGTRRPLVKESRVIVKPGVQVIEEDFPLTPSECAWLLLTLSLTICCLEWKRKLTFKYWDALLMLMQGIVGCVLFVMLFSQHPTTSTNLQLLLFNPLPLFFIPSVLKRRRSHWWKILPMLVICFVIGSFFQHYAEGMIIVALCLLSRLLIRIKTGQ